MMMKRKRNKSPKITRESRKKKFPAKLITVYKNL
jgi:hypothetical protein